MDEKSIALADIESVLGVKITAAALPEIGERRIRIAFASGARMTVVFSDDGKWQNAASFTAEDGSLLTEYVAILDGSAEIATPGANERPVIERYESGSMAILDADWPHATHPAAGSCIVGIMSAGWKDMKRTMHPEFDAAVKRLVSKGS